MLLYNVVCIYVECVAHETLDQHGIIWGLPDFRLEEPIWLLAGLVT